MHKKLLVALSLIAGQTMAMEPMELAIDTEQALPMNTEKKVVIIVQDHEREVPAQFIPLIGTLADLTSVAGLTITLTEFYKEGTPLSVSIGSWLLIEDQLKRVHAMTLGNQQVRKEIIAVYSKLTNPSLINLIRAIEFLDIPLLKEITQSIAQKKLTFDEILELPAYMRNEEIKRKARNSIAVPLKGKEVALFRSNLIRFLPSLFRRGMIHSVCVTPDGKIVTRVDDTVCVWDKNGQQLAVCRADRAGFISGSVTPEGYIVSCFYDKTVRIWDMNGQELEVLRGHDLVWSVCVTPDGKKIVSGSWDGTVRVWDFIGQGLAVCRGHGNVVFSVCVTPDDKIVSGSVDHTVRVWNMNGQELAVCRGHKGPVQSVCSTPDGKIVSGSWDKTIRVWSMDGRKLAVCRGHEGRITSVCITPDGKIVSGSDDKTVRVWDMNGQELAVCRGHERKVTSVCITADGKIVSGSLDKTIRFWDISLLHRLSSMNREQAQAISKILQLSAGVARKEQERNWEEIWKVFGKEEELNLSKWRSAEAIKVMLIASMSLLVAIVFLDLEIRSYEFGI